MSLDLLKEFGNSEGNRKSDTTLTSASIDILRENNDDFGDFEEPDLDVENIERNLKSGASIQASGCKDDTLYSHYLNSVDANSPPIFAKQKSGNAEVEERVGSSIFFDAEQTIAETSQNGKGPANVMPKRPVEKPTRATVTPTATPRDDQRPDKYDFDQENEWEPVQVAQEPLVPSTVAYLRDPAASSMATPHSCRAPSQLHTGPPPTNIPPPSVLLPVISGVFESLSAQVTTQKQPSDSPVIALAFARAGARIIAGRKLRWNRDVLLSQSMKIGPAGKPGGMKLTVVDKTESRREDQEVAEAINVWRKQVGQLRSAVSRISSNVRTTSVNVPEISEIMPIRVIKPQEGAVSAPKCCFLCGIRREERVAKVDVNNVEDSFGEYWTEHWGHVDCIILWEHIRASLKQR